MSLDVAKEPVIVYAAKRDDDKIVEIKAGANFVLMQTKGGKALSFGNCEGGCSGHLAESDANSTDPDDPLARIEQLTPKHLPLPGNVIALIAGGDRSTGHGFVITRRPGDNNTNVFGFGSNNGGKLGLPKEEDENDLWYFSPQLIPGLSGLFIVAGAAGHEHSVFLDKDGAMFACGMALHGRLGSPNIALNLNVGHYTLVPVPLLSPASAVFAGGCCSAALLLDVNVMLTGDNDQSQQGKGEDVSQNQVMTLVMPETFEPGVGINAVSVGSDFVWFVQVEDEGKNFGISESEIIAANARSAAAKAAVAAKEEAAAASEAAVEAAGQKAREKAQEQRAGFQECINAYEARKAQAKAEAEQNAVV